VSHFQDCITCVKTCPQCSSCIHTGALCASVNVRSRPRLRSRSAACIHLPGVQSAIGQRGFTILPSHSVEQSAICTVQQQQLNKYVQVAAANLSFRKLMNTVGRRCVISAILAPSVLVRACVTWCNGYITANDRQTAAYQFALKTLNHSGQVAHTHTTITKKYDWYWPNADNCRSGREQQSAIYGNSPVCSQPRDLETASSYSVGGAPFLLATFYC